ncbi:MAG: alpha-glucosidase/alpha-galactosidase [Clostridia bacterium]|nr:alpha-glucosidase/alpha-galactosidase [Clostridia bacterium]
MKTRRKFAFIGAGSMGFTRTIVKDLLTFPAFEDCEIALMDINPERLDCIGAACEKIRSYMGKDGCTITKTLNRAEALDGADGVLCTVFNGDIDVWRHEIEIPKEYGVDINIGDTRSVSGIFRAMRNIPLMLDICHDIEKYCPKAVFLNYTNPMSMLCRAMQTFTKVDVTGLCHSVQGTARMLAEWLGIPYDEIDYTCAGVNHQAFYLKFEHDGEDLYPALREKIFGDPVYYQKELVRNEMFRHLGYYVTESSGHNSEYNQWFRKRPDLIEKYCTNSTNWNPGVHRFSLDLRIGRVSTWKKEIEDWTAQPTLDTKRSNEYAANIFNARIGDHTPFCFNANVLNEGCISNLPPETCVEVPVMVDRGGLHKFMVGALPDHLAILVNTTARMENLAVDACMEGDREKVIRAVMMDPLTSAVCSLEEIREMCGKIFDVNQKMGFLTEFR